MAWDQNLASDAKTHSDQCNFAHSGAPGVGENLYATTVLDDVSETAVQTWASEGFNYDVETGTCSDGICGHYTQIVWDTSTKLGCAATVCSVGSPFPGIQNWQLVTCQYQEPGNFAGQRPYEF